MSCRGNFLSVVLDKRHVIPLARDAIEKTFKRPVRSVQTVDEMIGNLYRVQLGQCVPSLAKIVGIEAAAVRAAG